MFIKPARENLIVRDPNTFEILPIEGKEISANDKNFFYWKRRILDGDVIEVSAQGEDKTSSNKATKTGGKL